MDTPSENPNGCTTLLRSKRPLASDVGKIERNVKRVKLCQVPTDAGFGVRRFSRIALYATALSAMLPDYVVAAAGNAGQHFDLDNVAVFRQAYLRGLDEPNDRFAHAMVGGDFNGDAIDDLVVSAPGENSNAGVIYVLRGTTAGLIPRVYLFQSEARARAEAGDQFGTSVASGDFDGDGWADIVVGAPGENSNAGAISIWFGSSAGLARATGATFMAPNLGCGPIGFGDQFGFSVASGDFNDDEIDDIAIGVPGKHANAGMVCVVSGNSMRIFEGGGRAYVQSENEYTPSVLEPEERFGAVLTVGNFAGDHSDDLAISAPGEVGLNQISAGGVFVWFGAGANNGDNMFSAGIYLDQLSANIPYAGNGDGFGAALGSANLNGDGYDDLLIGAPHKVIAETATGMVFVFSGALGGPVLSVRIAQQSPLADVRLANARNEGGDLFGFALAGSDTNADGFDDLIVGSPGEGAITRPTGSGIISVFGGGADRVHTGSWLDQEALSTAGVSSHPDELRPTKLQ